MSRRRRALLALLPAVAAAVGFWLGYWLIVH